MGGARELASASSPLRLRRPLRPSLATIAVGVLLCAAAAKVLAFPAETSRRRIEVEIRGLAYSEPEVTVSVGATVRWTNRDVVPHTVTSVDGAWGSSLVKPGDYYEFTFKDTGEYSYYCIPHPFMKAKVVVIGEPERRR